MTCRLTNLGSGFVSWSCGRRETPSREALPACSVCGRREHELLCDYPLRGAKAGQTCSRQLCRACAVRTGEQDQCPAHAKAVRSEAIARGANGGSQ